MILRWMSTIRYHNSSPFTEALRADLAVINAASEEYRSIFDLNIVLMKKQRMFSSDVTYQAIASQSKWYTYIYIYISYGLNRVVESS